MKALSSTSVFPWEREEGRGTDYPVDEVGEQVQETASQSVSFIPRFVARHGHHSW